MRCRAASYRTTVAALAAFSELAAPVIGMLTRRSHSSRHPPLSPVPSFPTTSSVGPVKSASNTAWPPCSSAPASTTGQPHARRPDDAADVARAGRAIQHDTQEALVSRDAIEVIAGQPGHGHQLGLAVR